MNKVILFTFVAEIGNVCQPKLEKCALTEKTRQNSIFC